MNDMKKLQSQLDDRSNREDRAYIQKRMESLQQQLVAVDRRNIKRENERLQRDLDESNRRWEKILEEKKKEISECVKRQQIEYESKTNSENLRRRERDNIENENGGVVDDIIEGFKRVGSGMAKAGRKFLSFLGF